MNQVTLLGRVGADPQKKGTAEHPVVTFSLATHTSYNNMTGISDFRYLTPELLTTSRKKSASLFPLVDS